MLAPHKAYVTRYDLNLAATDPALAGNDVAVIESRYRRADGSRSTSIPTPPRSQVRRLFWLGRIGLCSSTGKWSSR